MFPLTLKLLERRQSGYGSSDLLTNVICMGDLLDALSTRIWVTRGCRFNAHERMLRSEKWGNLSICLSTVVIIIINLLIFYPPFSTAHNSITIVTISLSVLVLSISQFIYARDYKTKAQNYHSCGCELSELLNEIAIKKQVADVQLDDVSRLYKRYEKIIIRYNENHSTIDYDRFRVQNQHNKTDKDKNPKDSKFTIPWWKVCCIQFRYHWEIYAVFILLGIT